MEREFREHKNNSEIAQRHERSMTAIEKRQTMLVKKWHDEHKSDEEIGEMTNLTVEEVQIRVKNPL